MKQKKPLPKNAIIGIVVVAALLFAFVGYSLLVKPQKSELRDVKAQIQQTQQTIDDYRSQVASSQPTAAPKVRVADIYRLARAMPSVEGMPDILVELNSIAQSAGVAISQVTPSAPTPGAGFEIVPLQVTFSGDFFAATDFLFRLRTLVDVRHGQLEAAGRIFAVEQGSLTPSTGGDLQGQLTLQTYVYGAGGAPAASAAPAPAPASTDTTATTTTPTSTTSASAEGAP